MVTVLPPILRSRQRSERLRDAAAEPVHRQVHADDAGRGDQHLLDWTADELGGLGRHCARVGHAEVAGARVRAAAVDDDGAGHSAGGTQMLTRKENRRGLGEIGREHGGRARRRVGHE